MTFLEALLSLAARCKRRLASNPALGRAMRAAARRESFEDIYLHEQMLTDAVRLNAYRTAIERHVKPQDDVADIGTGTGILAFLASAERPRRIYAVDRSRKMLDYARAAATVLTQPGHENKTYELGGDQSFTMTELAAAVSEWAGRSIGYTNLPEAAFAQALTAAGLPGPYAEILADCDVGITRGELEVKSGDLHRLIGRDTTSVKSVLQALPKP